MLYHLLISLQPQVGVLNVARYITFRTAAASLTALAVSLVLGPWLIRRLREFQIGQVIRQGRSRTAPRRAPPRWVACSSSRRRSDRRCCGPT